MMCGDSNFKVISIPKIPKNIPNGILTVPKTKPSKNTVSLFCFLVAPTVASIPKYRLLSASEIPKELYINITDATMMIKSMIIATDKSSLSISMPPLTITKWHTYNDGLSIDSLKSMPAFSMATPACRCV